MADRCDICGDKIEETFLGKPKGSIIKVKTGNKNELKHVCDSCQKKYGDKVKDELK
ncbi:MAG: hypothetical protein WC796_05300 [Candidatus Pacearchaeota archaeon]|jgi:ribosome-binding protein aMBF1 (putative translation factor)